MADQFVRVRLSRIDGSDLNLFDFDYDLTFMVFFLNADEQVYARYGGRDPQSPDARQSLAGLHHAMDSVLKLHGESQPEFMPRRNIHPSRLVDIASRPMVPGCTHCHQVKEGLNGDLRQAGKWNQDRIWRFPLPDNLGIVLDVDAGTKIESVTPGSPAARAGLQPGHQLTQLNGLPVRTFADAQFVLDSVPPQGKVKFVANAAGQEQRGELELPNGWRRTQIGWRKSLREHIPVARFRGDDLSDEEKQSLGVPLGKMAFRQTDPLGLPETGVQAGDIVLDVDGRGLDLPGIKLRAYIAKHYVCGEQIRVDVIRDGQRREALVTLAP